ncbi:hypothetical protein G5I_02609 [Acromyrmex echinatior]|uniref:Uncharacterized protein n=1 Tax=Acromyrmex echinatior TaxID=103372 RepID=F4WAR7_ACREC|nr:hypothetical protein G5I_02609 [Acromyrmex echinatior]
MGEDLFSERRNGSVENRFPGELPGYYIELAGRRDRGLVQMEVARSRNEICVTRGPTSPGLALLLLSSAQPGAVQISSRRVARYIIQLCHSSYTHEPAKVRRGQRANRSNEREERETGRWRPLLFFLRAGNAVFVSEKVDNLLMVASKLNGMQSNLLAAANRLSGVDGGPNVSGGSAA